MESNKFFFLRELNLGFIAVILTLKYLQVCFSMLIFKKAAPGVMNGGFRIRVVSELMGDV